MEEGRDGFVELLFVLGGLERDGERLALGIADVFENIAAECSLCPRAEAGAQFLGIGVLTRVTRAEGGEVAEQVVVDELGKSVKLKERVLQRSGREENFSDTAEGAGNGLAKAILGAVAAAKFMGLIDDGDIPGMLRS